MRNHQFKVGSPACIEDDCPMQYRSDENCADLPSVGNNFLMSSRA